MKTNQLIKLILKDCRSASVLTGVYSINTLPVLVKPPAALIVNLDKSYNPGTHWVVIFINQQKHGYYFDSLGQPIPKEIKNFLQRNSKVFVRNKTQYQADDSTACGLFCIVYIYFAARGIPIVNKFYTQDLKRNDTLVKMYIRKIVNKNKKCM